MARPHLRLLLTPDAMAQSTRAPAALLVVAVALFFATVVACVTGISLLFPDSALNRIWELNRPAYIAFARLGTLAGGLLLALCALSAATTVGLLKRKRWAWWAAVGLFGVNGLGDLVTLALQGELIRNGSGLLIAALFLLCLWMPRTRRYFDLSRAGQ